MSDFSKKTDESTTQSDREVSSLAECLDGTDLDSVGAQVEESRGPEKKAEAAAPESAAHLAVVADRVKESVKNLPGDTRQKIRFTILSCLVLSVVLLSVLYVLDYLDMSYAEKIIYKWHVGSSVK